MPAVDAWMQTYTAQRFYLPATTSMFNVVDIAHSLGLLCRYNGHCKRFYSVAEHSVLMFDWAFEHLGVEYARAALFHDAAESYCADVPRPLKSSIPDYIKVIGEVEEAMAKWLGLDKTVGIYPPEIKMADWRILCDEKEALFDREASPWYLPKEGPLGVELKFWSPERATEEFLKRVALLAWLDTGTPYEAHEERLLGLHQRGVWS